MSQSRQLAAIMFTDIVGYTALMGNDEHKAFTLLEKNRQLQKPIIEEFNGRWIKELGDGVMASFNTVSDAVNVAVKIQETCNATKDFQLRIGIHQGEVVFENDDVFGDAVNIAARIQAAPVKVKSHGFGLGLDYQLPKNYRVYLNVYSDELSNVPAGFKTFYNTPKYRLNMGLSNSTLGKNKSYGFNIVYHWQDAFFFESTYGDKPINAYSTLDAQVSHTFSKNKSMMIKLGGTNILNHYYQNGFAHPYVGAIYYISILYRLN